MRRDESAALWHTTAPDQVSNPKYPKEARKQNIQGTTVLLLIVGPDGVPYDIRVVRTAGHGFDEEAVKAVQKWRFTPSTLDGHPVAVKVNVEVAFRLKQ